MRIGLGLLLGVVALVFLPVAAANEPKAASLLKDIGRRAATRHWSRTESR
jgi:hypothetical protein